MKPFVKHILVIGAAALAIGGALLGVSLLLGPRPIIGFQNGSLVAIDPARTERRVEEMDLPAFTSIRTDVYLADVRVVYGDSYGVELVSYVNELNESELDYRLDGETLVVTQGPTGGVVSGSFYFMYSDVGNTLMHTATIYLPHGTRLDTLDAGINHGGFAARDLQAGAVTVRSGFGDCILDGVRASTVNLDLQHADLSIDGFTADKITVENSFGTITIRHPDTGKLRSLTVTARHTDVAIEGVDAQQLTIEDEHAQATLRSVQAGTLRADLRYLDLYASGVTAGSAAITNQQSEVELHNWISDSLRLDLEHCGLTIVGTLRGETQIGNTYGSVSATTRLSRDSYSLDLGTTYGEIVIDNAAFGEHHTVNTAGAPNSLQIDAQHTDIEISFS